MSAGKILIFFREWWCSSWNICETLIIGLFWVRLVGHGLIWFGVVCFGLVWFGFVWFRVVWFCLACLGLVWFGLGSRVYHHDATCDGSLSTFQVLCSRLPWCEIKKENCSEIPVSLPYLLLKIRIFCAWTSMNSKYLSPTWVLCFPGVFHIITHTSYFAKPAKH